MKSHRIGYVRVSTLDQNTGRQLEGVELDRIFTDKASGRDVKRPALSELIQFAREGDTVVVHSLDRLARNLDDLRRVVQDLTKRGVRVEFVKEKLTFTGEDSPMATLLLSVMGSFAEFERSLICERQREGIALARKRGVYRGRRRSLSDAGIAEVLCRVESGESKASVARGCGISRETLYQYLASRGVQRKGNTEGGKSKRGAPAGEAFTSERLEALGKSVEESIQAARKARGELNYSYISYCKIDDKTLDDFDSEVSKRLREVDECRLLLERWRRIGKLSKTQKDAVFKVGGLATDLEDVAFDSQNLSTRIRSGVPELIIDEKDIPGFVLSGGLDEFLDVALRRKGKFGKSETGKGGSRKQTK